MKLIKTQDDFPINGYIFNYSKDEEGYSEIYYMIIRDGMIAMISGTYGQTSRREANVYEHAVPYKELSFIWDIENYYEEYVVAEKDDYSWVLTEEEVLLYILAENC